MRIVRGVNELYLGDFGHVITLRAPTYSNDGEGNVATSWTDTTVWAKVEPLGFSRTLEDAGITYNDSVRVFVRYDAAIKPTYRLIIHGKEYEVHSAEDINLKRQFIEILAYTKAL